MVCNKKNCLHAAKVYIGILHFGNRSVQYRHPCLEDLQQLCSFPEEWKEDCQVLDVKVFCLGSISWKPARQLQIYFPRICNNTSLAESPIPMPQIDIGIFLGKHKTSTLKRNNQCVIRGPKKNFHKPKSWSLVPYYSMKRVMRDGLAVRYPSSASSILTGCRKPSCPFCRIGLRSRSVLICFWADENILPFPP